MAAAHRARRRPLGGVVLLATTALVAAMFMSLTRSVAPHAGAAVVGQTWSDEFDGAAGRAPDAAKWTLETGGSGFGNHELQYYTSSTSNAALDGQAHLVITARKSSDAGLGCWYGQCQYTLARMNTAKTFTRAYVRFEARVKIPRGRALADDFHVFAVDWSPNSLAWSVDGTTYKTLTPAGTGGNKWVFDHPFFVILNLAVGGDWPGSPDASTSFPQTMTVDHVRASSAGASGPSASAWTSRGGSTADGAAVQLYTCNGTNAQKWTYTAARDLINTGAGTCLDATGNSSADGTRMQTWFCTGAANQKWTVG
ncbi:ricin-type beta-trefoil lectin domain protein [Streptomyces sp. NPDC020817]|uniref:ricin-type beta-trefoil lectin domain protein n=1 Tax=Streptomyces sp. NPDC020817 TaxID=3365095 RepID=UPI0037A68DF2